MPQHCEAADMLRFLFSFCGTSGDKHEVKPKEEEVKLAFGKVRELANEPNSSLRKRLTRA